MRTIATFACLTFFAALTITSLAHAQEDDPGRVAAARALFQEGVALARRGEYEQATDRFRRAQELRPAAPIAFNLASALAHQGVLVEASEILQRLLRDPSVTGELRDSVERARQEIIPRLARLTVRLEGDPQDVRVEIDTRELPAAAIGVALPVDPGPHDVRAQRDGADVARDRIELAEGALGEVVLTIPARSVASEAIVGGLPAADGDAAQSNGDDGVAIALGIVAAVAVVAGVTVTAVVLTAPQTPESVSGNAMPGVLTW
jgi:hypothetical protein